MKHAPETVVGCAGDGCKALSARKSRLRCEMLGGELCYFLIRAPVLLGKLDVRKEELLMCGSRFIWYIHAASVVAIVGCAGEKSKALSARK